MRWRGALAAALLLCLAASSVRAELSGLLGFRSQSTPWDPLCGDNLRIGLIPAEPTTEDPIRIICSGNWRDSCVPSYLTATTSPGKVQLRAVLDYPANVGCADVITGWSLETVVGPLPSGCYMLELYMWDLQSPSVVTLCAAKPFKVVGQMWSVFLPVLGCLAD